MPGTTSYCSNHSAAYQDPDSLRRARSSPLSLATSSPSSSPSLFASSLSYVNVHFQDCLMTYQNSISKSSSSSSSNIIVFSGPLDDLPRLWVLWGGPRPPSDHLSHEDSVREHLHSAHKWVGHGDHDDDGDDDGGDVWGIVYNVSQIHHLVKMLTLSPHGEWFIWLENTWSFTSWWKC